MAKTDYKNTRHTKKYAYVFYNCFISKILALFIHVYGKIRDYNRKYKKAIFVFFACVAIFFMFLDIARSEQKFLQISVLIHISTSISDGNYTPGDIASLAKKNGFDAVVFTDREVMRWEYGLFPLRNIIKKTIENSSVSTYGINCYLDTIKNLEKENPGMFLLAGIESTPFYYWSGSLFENKLSLHNAHKHLLIMGLNSSSDIKNLPIIANRMGFCEPFSFKESWRLWPLILIIAGISLIINCRQKMFRSSLEKNSAKRKRNLGIFFIAAGIIFCINEFPFCRPLVDQYHGDKGILPYQNLIDYVNKRNGLVFWAHPEAENYSRSGIVEVVTNKHEQDFYNTRDYTGFCIFYEGYKQIGTPGGLWDKVLEEYVNGKREKPCWAIGGLAFDYSNNLENRIKDLRNILLIRQNSEQAVLDALRNGCVYVARGNDSSVFILDSFVVSGVSGSQAKTMGQTLLLDADKPKVRIAGHFDEKVNAQGHEVALKIIKNGNVIKTFKNTCPFDVEYIDDSFIGEDKAYYRLEIISSQLHLIANPIFVTRLKTQDYRL